jgi:hypothetical protein
MELIATRCLTTGPNVLYPHPSQQDPTQPELFLRYVTSCVHAVQWVSLTLVLPAFLRDVNTANAVVETIIASPDFFFPPVEEQDTLQDVVTTITSSNNNNNTDQEGATNAADAVSITITTTTPLDECETVEDFNSLQRRRSNINVLKQFFEDKSPPASLKPTNDDRAVRCD